MTETLVPIFIVFTATPWGETILNIFFTKEEAQSYVDNASPIYLPFLYIRDEFVTKTE